MVYSNVTPQIANGSPASFYIGVTPVMSLSIFIFVIWDLGSVDVTNLWHRTPMDYVEFYKLPTSDIYCYTVWSTEMRQKRQNLLK